jgi:YVTN family beta-propeller protein
MSRGETSKHAIFAFGNTNAIMTGGLELPTLIPAPNRRGARSRDAGGGDPEWIASTPDSKTPYLANAALDSVSAIDLKTRKQVTVIPVGRQPDHVFTFVRPWHERAIPCDKQRIPGAVPQINEGQRVVAQVPENRPIAS